MSPRAFAQPRRAPVSYARLFAFAGFAAAIVPTIVSIARLRWTDPEGTHGPIILATGAWLLWRERGRLSLEAAPMANFTTATAFAPLAVIYACARLFDLLFVEAITAYGMTILLALTYLGPPLMRRLWFPFFYMGFLIPPPPSLVAELTQPLKLWISVESVDVLHRLGYPVALSGTTIQIAQHELMVRTACAGLNSMLTLSAIGLFYVHLHWKSGARNAFALLLAILPIAVFANLARVLILVLLTYYLGEAVAQGVAHELAGLLMFCIAILCLLGVDSVLSALGAKSPLEDG